MNKQTILLMLDFAFEVYFKLKINFQQVERMIMIF